MWRFIGLLIVAIGWAGFVGTIIVPAVALIGGSIGALPADADSWWPSARQWGLLGRTALMAGAGTLLSLVMSMVGVLAMGGGSRLSRTPVLASLLFVPLLVPPMVLVFGWQRLLGGYWFRDASPVMRTIWVWASWGWPVAALLLSAGWSRAGRSAYEAALLVSSRRAAFFRAAMPALRRHVVVAGLMLFVLFVGDYGVPHANGVFVIASELMDTAGGSGAAEVAGRVVRVGWPLVVLLAGVMAVVCRTWAVVDSDGRNVGRAEMGSDRWAVVAAVLMVAIGVALPVLSIAGRGTLVSDLVETVSTYGSELLGSVGICVAAGALAVLMGVAMTVGRWSRGIGMVGMLLFGLLPGAVAGTAVLVAYTPAEWMESYPRLAESMWWLYSRWPILVIGLASRFAWVGWLAGWVAGQSMGQSSVEVASLDGAGGIVDRVIARCRQQWPVLLCGWVVVFSMALAEFSVVGLLRVPSPTMLAMVLIEKFHRFENGMLAALCVCMVAGVVPGVVIPWIAFRRRENRIVRT